MLISVSPRAAVHSDRGESVNSDDSGRSAKVDAPISSALDGDHAFADTFDHSTELRAYRKGLVSKRGGRVQLQASEASLKDNTREGAASSPRLTNGRQAEMQACILHEISQPVTALVTNAQAALRFLDAPNQNLKESQDALTRVLHLGNRIIEIMRRTRDLLQRVSPQKEDFEINHAIREILSLSQEDQVKNDVSVHTRFAEGLPLVRADQIQVQQVILNLITNAVEAMSGLYEGTRELCISTVQTTSGDVLVTVQDSGPGLDALCSDQLFDAFYSTKPRGLGIGLSICRAIIEAHGGRLWASLSEPQGARFQFTLPQIRSDHMRKALQRCENGQLV